MASKDERFIGEVERFEVQRRIFDRAAARPKPERKVFIADASKDDPAIVKSVRGLIAANEGSGSKLNALKDLVFMTPTTPAIPNHEVDDTPLKGGMGYVYHARHKGWFHREVAVKVLRPEYRGDPSIVDRFKMEIRLLEGLRHPNLPRLTDAGQLPDRSPYAIMEWIRGQSVREYMEGRGLDKRIALFLQIARTVAFLHDQSVVHRDIKMGNILVTADGVAMLFDFGIAKDIGPLKESFTMPGGAIGTPGCMSDEQAQGAEARFPADVYALGLLLNELLTDQLPSVGLITTRLAVSPRKLARIVVKAVSTLPEKRYPDAGRMADAVESAMTPRWRRRVYPDNNGIPTVLSRPTSVAIFLAPVLVLGGLMWLNQGLRHPPVDAPKGGVQQPIEVVPPPTPGSKTTRSNQLGKNHPAPSPQDVDLTAAYNLIRLAERNLGVGQVTHDVEAYDNYTSAYGRLPQEIRVTLDTPLVLESTERDDFVKRNAALSQFRQIFTPQTVDRIKNIGLKRGAKQ